MEQSFRVVRVFGQGITPSVSRAYRVETTELLTENEAFKLMKELGSPYIGRKYEETKPEPKYVPPVGTEVKTRAGTFPSIPFVKQEDGTWKPKYKESDESL